MARRTGDTGHPNDAGEPDDADHVDHAGTPSRPVARAGPRRSGGFATIVGAAVLAAVLAAGGTAALVTGPLARGRKLADRRPGRGLGRVGLERRSRPPRAEDLTDVVAAVRDSVVTITSEGFSSRGFAQIPSTGVGSGDRPDRRRLHPHQQARRGRQPVADRRARRRRAVPGDDRQAVRRQGPRPGQDRRAPA